MNFADDP
ncbi:hypothetical protein F383_25966 [Gossypium arboreum]|nr:hypothetical protein F383_25966 [Gossypium arboreum]